VLLESDKHCPHYYEYFMTYFFLLSLSTVTAAL